MLNSINHLFFRKLFIFEGRSNRKEYIINLLLQILCIVVWFFTQDFINSNSLLSGLYTIMLGSFLITLYIQYFPLAVRRLHDFNWSGWRILIMLLPLGQLLIFWLMFRVGTQGSNEYGELPNYNKSYLKSQLKSYLLIFGIVILLAFSVDFYTV